MKRLFSIFLVIALAFGMTACGDKEDEGKNSTEKNQTEEAKGSVYFLNFKPEIATVYEEIAKEYEKETGVKIKVVTAASNTYEQTLKSEIAKSEAPTIFQVNGPVGYTSWENYCEDISDSKLYENMSDTTLAISDGDGVYAIPYTMEGYGIIYNQDIMDKYFALKDRKAVATSMDEIRDFESWKDVVEDMTKHKKQLGIDGVFANTSLSAGNQWRWQSHLANIMFEEEFAENSDYDNATLAGLATSEAAFKYSDSFKNVFDLYLNNSTTDRKMLGSKTVDDSMSEFALGKCAMVQNGNWAWEQIKGVKGNKVKEDKIKMMPIYTGTAGDTNRGLCIGTENYLAINKNASDEDKKASLDFLAWLYSSEKGKKYVISKLGFIAPFSTFTEKERPSDPLAKEVVSWMNKEGIKNVTWAFAAFPSEQFKEDFGNALLEYAQGTKSFDDVVKTVKGSWKNEYEEE